MSKRKVIWLGIIGLLVMSVLVVVSCTTTTEVEEKAAALTAENCSTSHNDTTLIVSKKLQWEQSGHATGGAYVRGTSATCAGCHSSEGFTARIAAGLDPDEVKAGIPNPSPQNCRTCHQIHTTYTRADFALKTTAPVTLFVSGETFDMGKGNLCTNCHQPRRPAPEVGGGDVKVTSTHWGPHYGTQSATLLGIGGYGAAGSPSAHYMVVDGCPVCHMADQNHTLEPKTAACQSCHGELDSFDRNGVQTEVQALIDELEELLEAKGLLHDGHPVVGEYSEEEAGALWNYIFVTPDGSLGVHNSAYTKALLQSAIEALK